MNQPIEVRVFGARRPLRGPEQAALLAMRRIGSLPHKVWIHQEPRRMLCFADSRHSELLAVIGRDGRYLEMRDSGPRGAPA
jgi:hypothetical protein